MFWAEFRTRAPLERQDHVGQPTLAFPPPSGDAISPWSDQSDGSSGDGVLPPHSADARRLGHRQHLVVLGHGLDPSRMAKTMPGATSRNVVQGLECVGPLKVVDTMATTPLDIGAGSIAMPSAPGWALCRTTRS
jgi:hypothetical protein